MVAAAPEAAADVAHVGIDSQYSSTVPVDAHGDPVGPLIMYLDYRGADHCIEILARDPDAFMMFIERHGIPPVGAGLSLSHVLHFQLDEPDVHARTTAYLEVMEFVGARLTGVIAGNQCTAFTSQLIDNRVLGATEYDPDMVAASGVDVDKLPRLRPMDEPAAGRTGAPGRRGRARHPGRRRWCTGPSTTATPEPSQPAPATTRASGS